ncbi:Ig-like domain-containing protein [bacterium]|nr:Ig-like domain-containing protein [bacterium]
MRKLTFILSILSVLAVSLRTTALPPQWFEVEYHAYVEVFDLNNNPVSGVPVKLTVDARIGEEEYYNIIRTSTGYTNSNGYVSLTCYIDYYDYPQLNCMFVNVQGTTYSVFQQSGTYSNSSRTIYPDIWVMTQQDDQDIDGIPDIWESQIAEKFKPVLHKHHDDLQGGLYNFEELLDNHSTLCATFIENIDHYDPYTQENTLLTFIHSKTWRGNPLNLHQVGVESGDNTDPDFPKPYPCTVSFPYTWAWNSFKKMDENASAQTQFLLDIDNDIGKTGHSGSPVGTRPVYYHVYKMNDVYYLQYWYFFTMNDISSQTQNEIWHEGDWEHVSIKINRENGVFKPQEVNFYIHSGGITYSASTCWWSGTQNATYTGLQRGYDEAHTHLHIWIAKNAHASYNRNAPVYQFAVQVEFGIS